MLSMKFDGGKAVVQRILQAYGFTMQKQLHDHLGVGNGTVSTWIKRNYFPGEVVIRCALETGADLEWLATGEDKQSQNDEFNQHEKSISDIVDIPFFSIDNSSLVRKGTIKVDYKIFNRKFRTPIYVSDGCTDSWIVETEFGNPTDGLWLVERVNNTSIEYIRLLPHGEILIKEVSWPLSELKLLGKVAVKLKMEI